MTRTDMALICAGIVIVVFLAMWLGWRARARRDALTLGSAPELRGDVIASFDRLQYVSTTPVGEPLTRVAAPGLRYRGRASVTVRHDGVTVQVIGEQPVHLPATRIIGATAAARRVGKAVEEGGLALLVWREATGSADPQKSESRELESSFRFDDREQQQLFSESITQISGRAASFGAAAEHKNPQHITKEEHA